MTESPDNPFQNLRARTLIPFTIFVAIGLYLAFRIVAGMTPIDPEDPATEVAAAEIALYGALALWIWWACRRTGIGIRRLVGPLPAGYSWLPVLGILVVSGLFSYGTWYSTAYGLSRIAPGMLALLIEPGPLMPTGSIASGVMWTLSAVVLAPVLEEVIFRGILVNRLGVKWGVRTGIVVSSVLFGVGHPVDPAGAMVFGLVAAVLYFQTRTLIVPIAFHAANNLVVTVLVLVDPDEGPFDLAAELQEIEAMALPGLGIAAVTLPVLVWYLQRHWPARRAEIPYDVRGFPE